MNVFCLTQCIVDFNKYLLKVCMVQIRCLGCDKRVLLGILATMSGLANDRKHTFVNALFTQPWFMVLFVSWSWVKDFFQNRQSLWGKCTEPLSFGPLLKCIFDLECFRYKPHPQFFTKQTRLNLPVLISFVLRNISAARVGKVFSMFWASELRIHLPPWHLFLISDN